MASPGRRDDVSARLSDVPVEMDIPLSMAISGPSAQTLTVGGVPARDTARFNSVAADRNRGCKANINGCASHGKAGVFFSGYKWTSGQVV